MVACTAILGVAAAAGADAAPNTPSGDGPAAVNTHSDDPGRAAGSGDDPTSALDTRGQLPPDWRAATDRLWTVRGDATGLHLLAAEQRRGYAWRTVTTLSEPGVETDRWVGNACLTESGRYAVVVYGPRAFTNDAALFLRGGFTAVVDMESGAVRKLPVRATLAYFNPGCGTGETVILTQSRFSEESNGPSNTRLLEVDAPTARITPVTEQVGQLTSAVPTPSGVVAARGRELVVIGPERRVRRLTSTASTAAHLTVDADGGVMFLTGSRRHNAVSRVDPERPGHRPVAVATSRGSWLGVSRGHRGQVFITGQDVRPRTAPHGVRLLRAHPTARISTGGDAAIVPERTPRPADDTAAWRKAMTSPRTGPDAGPAPVSMTVRFLHNDARVKFEVRPGLRSSPHFTSGQRAAYAPASIRTGSARSLGAQGTAEPDATCSVPRNDPHTQVYQPTARQVEWAADQAVVNNLQTPRPANWKESGLPSWTPQQMFPSRSLEGGGRVPVQILLGILAQESNLWQASGHALPGVTGNPLVGNYYGREVYDADGSNDWDIHFGQADCGYGVGQITDGMRKAGHARPGEVLLPENQQRAVALDYETNIARALQMLQEKWNQTHRAGLIHDDGDPSAIENWIFAVWAYNSGFHPNRGDGSAWGVGWLNNPANPIYPPNRYLFNTYGTDPAHPQDWPYEEKVIGWAAYSIATPAGPGFRPAWWVSAADREAAEPPTYAFCDASNDCEPGASYTPTAPEVSGAPAGPCAHQNSVGQYDLKCWYHQPMRYQNCESGYCGHELLRFNTSYPEQPDGTNYPPVCTLAGLPSGAWVVDDVPASVDSPRPGCGHPWTERGSFSLDFASDSAKVDFHQIGAGFGGHFWFAHTRRAGAVDGRMELTGTWRFSSELNGRWARVLVHIPGHGAHTQQAAYRIGLGDGTYKTRYALQRIRENTWISLGVMQFHGRPTISLSTQTYDGHGDDDVAWDAVALQPLDAKPRNFVVAMGDSYSSGEGASDPDGGDDYYPATDFGGDLTATTGRNACHRSPYAWSRKAYVNDRVVPIGGREDNFDPNMDYHLVACSGAETENLLPYHSVPAGQSRPENAFGEKGAGQWGEVSQMDKGYLDENTTLVTLSIGGNDAQFGPVVTQCMAYSWLTDCQDQTFAGMDKPARDYVPEAIRGPVRDSVEDAVREIHERAPNAKIVLMGYPRLIEKPGDCYTAFLNESEALWINDMSLVMANSLALAALELRDTDGIPVEFANPIPDFRGSAICGDPETIHGVVANKTAGDDPSLKKPSQQSFHPKIEGTTLYSYAANRAIAALGE
jgi:hypothetical protein